MIKRLVPLIALVLVASLEAVSTSEPDLVLIVAPGGPELRLEMSREEAESLVGPPEKLDLGVPEYPSRGFALMYDKNSKLGALLAGQSCSPGVLSQSFRGSLAGLTIGMSESQVVDLLGSPASVDGDSAEKLLRYSSGITVSLAEDHVHHVAVARRRPSA